MPQLDKISFATQYFWLTLFFFGLYFLSVNFFVILVFKNLKLRNTIYKIWYFFLYKFDYAQYNNQNKSLTSACFNSIYYTIYANFFLIAKVNFVFSKTKSLLNKIQILDKSKNIIFASLLNNFLGSSTTGLIKKINKINIDEI